MVRTLILISWDGRTTPLDNITSDAAPDFDTLLFNYSGGSSTATTHFPVQHRMSKKTECKGQIFSAFTGFLEQLPDAYDYVALIDDDISVKISALNGAIALASDVGLDSFAMSLTADSYVNHRRFVARPGSTMRAVPWVEVMMPFYRRSLFDAASPFFDGSVSSYGIDQFLMPMVCKLTGLNQVALIDAFSAGHHRPVTSDGRIYSNGLTAHQERAALRQRCIAELFLRKPELLGTWWFYRTFAPLNGPARFWSLYLGWPVHLAQRLVSTRNTRHDHA